MSEASISYLQELKRAHVERQRRFQAAALAHTRRPPPEPEIEFPPIDLVVNVLAPALPYAPGKRLTVRDIQFATCDVMGVTLRDLVGPSRKKEFTRPRFIAIWLCRNLLSGSLNQLSGFFGQRDHTTILYGYQKMVALMQASAEVYAQVDAVLAVLRARGFETER